MFKIKILTKETEKRDLNLHKFRQFPNPYRHYTGLTGSEKEIIALNEILHLTNDKSSVVFAAFKGIKLTSLLIFKENNYNSSIFNIGMGDLYVYFNNSESSHTDIFKRLLNKFFCWLLDKNFQHVSIRIDSSKTSIIKILLEQNFYIMETLVKYLAFANRQYDQRGSSLYKTYFYKEKPRCLNNLEELAYNSFSKDHYHMDPYLNDEDSNLIFKKWLTNALKGYMGSEVLYMLKNNTPVSFISSRPRTEICKGISKNIWGKALTATSKDCKGAFVYLVKECLRKYSYYCDMMEMETQYSNIEVIRIFEKFNFKIAGSNTTLHWHI